MDRNMPPDSLTSIGIVFSNLTHVHDQDTIEIGNGSNAMSDRDNGQPSHLFTDRGMDLEISLKVDTGRFIHDNDLGLTDQSTSERDQLTVDPGRNSNCSPSRLRLCQA